jgi:hypothetical protein
MTFDMTRCKVGDKLKTRGDKKVILENIWDTSDIHYPYELDNGETVTEHGSYSRYGDTDYDIVGFWEEEGELSEDEESFPNIEVRTPHIAKIITYRVHFNEMFHRDMSEQEAVAIYQQLKELLGEK